MLAGRKPQEARRWSEYSSVTASGIRPVRAVFETCGVPLSGPLDQIGESLQLRVGVLVACHRHQLCLGLVRIDDDLRLAAVRRDLTRCDSASPGRRKSIPADRLDGPCHSRIGRREEADKRDHQQRGIERVGAVYWTNAFRC
jgi:hypothetical protein